VVASCEFAGKGAGQRGLDDTASDGHLGAIIDLATAFAYVSGEEAKALEAAHDECSKTLYGLLRKLDDPPRPT
jgi:hypothetical protein